MSASKPEPCVWVGYLNESVNETTLRNHFKKFGPIRNVEILKDKSKLVGYIHYHNHEVAEVASQEMNGKLICNKKIQTKGPKQQLPSSIAISEQKDVKSLTDCYYFILNGTCKPKLGQKCQYRHMEKLRYINTVCERWSNRSCTNKLCQKLHPSQKSIQAEASKSILLNRCDSHHAFKCYGQCGKENCNTHFQIEQDIIDHVMKEKPNVETCYECNAVFFDAKEKLEHRHNKETNTSDNKKVSLAKRLSDKVEPIGVFWDIENCQVPKGKSALAVVQKIRETFYPGRREVEFMCVCDTTKEKKEILEELNRSQINIIHINATSKNAADDKLKQSLRRFAQAHKPPATIVLISGDINFASELSDLRHRHNLRVILLHNQQASSVLLQCANECHRFDQFSDGLAAMDYPQETDAPKEVIVTNLPSGNRQHLNKVRNQLKILVDNTGGKVQLFEDPSKESTAVIKFADSELAKKAIIRLNNEEVFGSKIKVKLKKLSKQQTTTPNKENSKNNNQTGLISNFKNVKAKSTLALSPQPHAANTPNNASSQKSKKSKTILNNTGNNILPDFWNKQFPIQHPSFQGMNTSLPPVAPMDFTGMFPPGFPIPPPPLMHPPNRMPPPGLMPQNMISQNMQNNSQSGVDLLITNLDETLTPKELKKNLVALVRENCKVNSVIIAGQNKDNVHAFVKVPKLQDANLCISKLNNYKFFNQNIKVSLASAKEHALIKMKSEVSALLFDTYAGWMPLNDFLLTYKEHYKKALHVLHLDQIKDLVYVDGKAGSQFICLLHYPIGLLKVKQEEMFNREVVHILKVHNRRVPFASLPGLYWSYTKKKLPLNETGEMLVKVALNKDICLVGNVPQNQIIFAQKPKPSKGQKIPLDDFQVDIIQLLNASPGLSVAFNRLVPLYNQFFGRQLYIGDYGYKELHELLKELSEVIEITEQKDSKTVSFTPRYKQILLNNSLTQLLTAREKHKLPLNSLLTAYYRYFGHKLYYRNYGYSSFLVLISSLDRKFKLSGIGEGKVLMLSPQKKKPNHKTLKMFAEEVATLIRSKPNKQLGFHNLSSEFYKHYGRQLKLAELGFTKLNDLVAAISDFVEIRGSRDQKILYMSDDHLDFDGIWKDVEDLVKNAPGRCILGLQLPDIYEENQREPFPLDTVKMNQFFKKSSSSILVIGKGSHRIIVDINPVNYPYTLLMEQLVRLAYTCEHFKANADKLVNMLREKGIVSNKEVVQQQITTANLFQLNKDKSFQLQVSTSQKLFELDIIQMLYDEPGHHLLLNHFGKTYTKKFGKVLRVSDYGVSKLMHLFDKITSGFVKVEHPAGGGQPTVSLGQLGKLCMDCNAVMNDNNGSLLLCNFAPEYQSKFSTQLHPNEYGFSKICELVDCFSCVFKIYGEKNMKVVVQRDRILNPVFEAKEVASSTSSSSDDSESDSDVIIESEEFETKEQSEEDHHGFQPTDLLQFSTDADDDGDGDGDGDDDDDYQQSKLNQSEWWMDPLPNLPEPILQPEQHNSGIGFDLISFTEFENEDIRSGGIDDSSLPPPLIPNSLSSTYSDMKKRNKSSSDDFVDLLFSEEIPDSVPQQEPDLMRLLVGRCSPVDHQFRSNPLPHQQSNTSSSMSGISETYSCFNDIKSLHLGSTNRIVRPKLAANFSKH